MTLNLKMMLNTTKRCLRLTSNLVRPFSAPPDQKPKRAPKTEEERRKEAEDILDGGAFFKIRAEHLKFEEKPVDTYTPEELQQRMDEFREQNREEVLICEMPSKNKK